MAVADYNTDPDLNTTISGINIAEGCPPSGINNALRQMMADVKNADDANVKLSGDQTIAGAKFFTSPILRNSSTTSPTLKPEAAANAIRIWSSISSNTAGATLYLISDDFGNSSKGQFLLATGTAGSTRVTLAGTPGGSLKWNGNEVQTSSDERLKTAFSDVPDEVLDAWGKVQWQRFKFRDAAAEKGEENARWHNGLVAQRVKAVFEAEGLDACEYGILCFDEWQDEYDEEGALLREAGDMWMIRYGEAEAMEAAYQRRRATRAEARITALEQRFTELEQAIAALVGGAE